jgi:D-arabinose 1-dehydrogenase-like Zn-dependent alcohol dehydrogenase
MEFWKITGSWFPLRAAETPTLVRGSGISNRRGRLTVENAASLAPAEPALGQPVFVSARNLSARAGCYAEYIAVPARAAHSLPPGCSLEGAACLSNYQVAYHVLHTAARGVEAKRVLVHTAANGVGSAAVQLALIAGLEVIGVPARRRRPERSLDLARNTRSTTAARMSSPACASLREAAAPI